MIKLYYNNYIPIFDCRYDNIFIVWLNELFLFTTVTFFFYSTPPHCQKKKPTHYCTTNIIYIHKIQLSQSDLNPKTYIIQRSTNNRKRNYVAPSSYNNLRLTRSTRVGYYIYNIIIQIRTKSLRLHNKSRVTYRYTLIRI